MRKASILRSALEGAAIGVIVNLLVVFPLLGSGFWSSMIGGAVTGVWIFVRNDGEPI